MFGSSPRVWGLPVPPSAGWYEERFIPTCVGFTRVYVCACACGAVHPHVCGVYYRIQGHRTAYKPVHPHVCGVYKYFYFSSIKVNSVHPHVCGVYGRWRRSGKWRRGSSPRVWGLPIPPLNDYHFPRFIPTCVGFTLTDAAITVTMDGSSPRVWGLQIFCCNMVCCNRFIPTCVGFTVDISCTRDNFCGSSPRVWGLRLLMRRLR